MIKKFLEKNCLKSLPFYKRETHSAENPKSNSKICRSKLLTTSKEQIRRRLPKKTPQKSQKICCQNSLPQQRGTQPLRKIKTRRQRECRVNQTQDLAGATCRRMKKSRIS